MKVLDPGHVYELAWLDGPAIPAYSDEDGRAHHPDRLTFVKREGEKYPGNVGAHAGTTTQEVLRALIDRMNYVNAQLQCMDNDITIRHLREALWHLERRAASRRDRRMPHSSSIGIENFPTCPKCGHIHKGEVC